MSTVIISPHTDDAIFSLGSYLSHLIDEDVTIASPMAGIPRDEPGRTKHVGLRREHTAAARVLLPRAKLLNGDFLDDVYEPPPVAELRSWLSCAITGADTVFAPLGIHHPDHVMVSDAMMGILEGRRGVSFYEELPYRLLYPRLLAARLDAMSHLGRARMKTIWPTPIKERALREYASQVDDTLVAKLMGAEHIWSMA